MSKPPRRTYSVQTIATLLKLTPRRVQQLSADGVIPKSERGQYELAPAVQGYIGYLQDRLAPEGGDDPDRIDYKAERARKLKAEADIAEMNAAKMRGDLLDGEELQEMLILVIAEITTKLLNNAPTRIASRTRTMKTVAPIKAAAKAEIAEALQSLSETDPARLLGIEE